VTARRPVLAALPIAALAGLSGGCGGGTKGDEGVIYPHPTAIERPQRGCDYGQIADVERIASGEEVDRLDLAPDPGTTCATIFRAGGGYVAAGITEYPGGAKALRSLRTAKTAELGTAFVRAAPALGPGAFVARSRYLAFRHGARVVALETGYDGQGNLLLAVRQLTALARIIERRL
jgi:hypothetical protein